MHAQGKRMKDENLTLLLIFKHHIRTIQDVRLQTINPSYL
jgi:hypothetical protein